MFLVDLRIHASGGSNHSISPRNCSESLRTAFFVRVFPPANFVFSLGPVRPSRLIPNHAGQCHFNELIDKVMNIRRQLRQRCLQVVSAYSIDRLEMVVQPRSNQAIGE
jgi:hypothetical protein